MAMNIPSLNASGKPAPSASENVTLEPAVRTARELSRLLAQVPESAPEARHPNYGVARALALTLIDMLDDMSRDSEGDGARRRNGGQ